MTDFQYILGKVLLISEVTAGIVGVVNYKKFKGTYWKWFIYYLVFIAVSELLCEFIFRHFRNFLNSYFDFFIIPIEFLMLYWLYSYKSLGRKKLFWIASGLYILSLFPFPPLEKVVGINSFNYCIGVLLLSIMIILEYNKQMKTDDILKFKENMMFYINTGVGLFYVGTLPYFGFHGLIWKDLIIGNNYHIIFLITNILMYTLFSIALLWGKPNTY